MADSEDGDTELAEDAGDDTEPAEGEGADSDIELAEDDEDSTD